MSVAHFVCSNFLPTELLVQPLVLLDFSLTLFEMESQRTPTTEITRSAEDEVQELQFPLVHLLKTPHRPSIVCIQKDKIHDEQKEKSIKEKQKTQKR
jgi:hypothetical protein